MTHHEGFGKLLASLESSSGQRWADHRNVADLIVFVEEVGDAPYQWLFGTHNHEVDVVRQDELFDRTEVVRVDVDVGATLCRAGIARSDEKFNYAGALSDFAGEGVFTTSGSQQENI